MKPKYWGVIALLLMLAVAAAPAQSREAYIASANMNGDATYMALNPNGSISDPQKLMAAADYNLSGFSFGNGIGDFNNDGELDYIVALGRKGGDIYVFPKTGSGPQFDQPIWAGEWTDGYYPADIAVADFNGDGNMDFVLNYFNSTACGLYLGDGTFGFTFTPIENASPSRAFSIDAADFNNDEIADFVVAPNGFGPFYVNLGNPDGTFTTVFSDRTSSTKIAYGIAAGNFIEDGDGFVDLAVSAGGELEIYRGNGDGTFVLEYSWDLDINTSPLDNGDFNRDGHQDVMVGDYGADHTGVAVLLGNGQGEFEWDYTYLGENIGYRKAVTALPYVPNIAPVAHVTPETIKVTVGETVAWDASGSYDEDGSIVSYEWDHGDGVVTPMAMMADTGVDPGDPQSSYVYYDSGTYYVTLKVTDDQGASTTVQAEVQVEPMKVGVYFSPRKLNKKSKGKWITATIQVPGTYDARLIDVDSLFLDVNGKTFIKARTSYKHNRYQKYFKKYAKKYGKKYRRAKKLKVKFDRQALIDALGDDVGKIELTVTGDILSEDIGLDFAGTGTILAFEKQKKKSLKKHLWQKIFQGFAKSKSKNYKWSRH